LCKDTIASSLFTTEDILQELYMYLQNPYISSD